VTKAVNLSADDRLDIMDLYARYAWAMDGGDTEAFLDVFLPDATLYMARSATGHAALRTWHETFLKDSAFPGSQHFATQFRVVEVDGDQVKMRVYVARLYRLPGTTHSSVVWQGYYTDTVVKVDGRWYYALKNAHEASQLRRQEFEATPYPVATRFYDLGGERA
jgi:ketosteroid isomerase-like protein